MGSRPVRERHLGRARDRGELDPLAHHGDGAAPHALAAEAGERTRREVAVRDGVLEEVRRRGHALQHMEGREEGGLDEVAPEIVLQDREVALFLGVEALVAHPDDERHAPLLEGGDGGHLVVPLPEAVEPVVHRRRVRPAAQEINPRQRRIGEDRLVRRRPRLDEGNGPVERREPAAVGLRRVQPAARAGERRARLEDDPAPPVELPVETRDELHGGDEHDGHHRGGGQPPVRSRGGEVTVEAERRTKEQGAGNQQDRDGLVEMRDVEPRMSEEELAEAVDPARDGGVQWAVASKPDAHPWQEGVGDHQHEVEAEVVERAPEVHDRELPFAHAQGLRDEPPAGDEAHDGHGGRREREPPRSRRAAEVPAPHEPAGGERDTGHEARRDGQAAGRRQRDRVGGGGRRPLAHDSPEEERQADLGHEVGDPHGARHERAGGQPPDVAARLGERVPSPFLGAPGPDAG